MTNSKNEKVQKAIEDLTEENSKEELARQYLSILGKWQKVPAKVRSMVELYGEMIGLIKRNYKRDLGILKKVKWEPTEYHVYQVDKEFDKLEGESMREERLRKDSAGVVQGLDIIHDREPQEKDSTDNEE